MKNIKKHLASKEVDKFFLFFFFNLINIYYIFLDVFFSDSVLIAS